MAVADRIEREVVINAPLERVWEFVKVPGWWVGEGYDVNGSTRRREGDIDVLEDPRYGRFPITTVALDGPRYAAFRWRPDASPETPTARTSTLVEFRLTEADGGTRVQVAESGFGALPMTEDALRRQYEDNVEGWSIELDYLRRQAEAVSV